MDKKRKHDGASPLQPKEPSARRQKGPAAAISTLPATYNPNFRRSMTSWFRTVSGDITKAYQKMIASYPIPVTDEEVENSKAPAVWYLDDASEYLRRINMAAYLYGGKTGEIVSFGNDEAYQLGQVSNFYKERQTEYPPGAVRGKLLKEVRHAAAGGLHSVCTTVDGEAYSWGSSDEGCLGRNSDDPTGDENQGLGQCRPTVVTGFVTLDGENKDGTMVAVSAGDGHTIYLSAGGLLFMTGMYKDMDSGKFAHPTTRNGSPIGYRDRPVQVEMPQNVIYVTCGHSFNAAILEDNTMRTWGKYSYCVVSHIQ
jgi:hypothetical protein